ncbi:hypothetical protein ACN28S_03035 [Cystobacter fuscus]
MAVHANGHAPQVLSVVRPHGVARTSVRLVLEPGQSLVGQTVVKGTKEPLPLVQLVLSAMPRDLAPGIPPSCPPRSACTRRATSGAASGWMGSPRGTTCWRPRRRATPTCGSCR